MGMGCDCELEGWPRMASTAACDMSFCTRSRLACVNWMKAGAGAEAGCAGAGSSGVELAVVVVVVFLVVVVSDDVSVLEAGPHEVTARARVRQAISFFIGKGEVEMVLKLSCEGAKGE